MRVAYIIASVVVVVMISIASMALIGSAPPYKVQNSMPQQLNGYTMNSTADMTPQAKALLAKEGTPTDEVYAQYRVIYTSSGNRIDVVKTVFKNSSLAGIGFNKSINFTDYLAGQLGTMAIKNNVAPNVMETSIATTAGQGISFATGGQVSQFSEGSFVNNTLVTNYDSSTPFYIFTLQVIYGRNISEVTYSHLGNIDSGAAIGAMYPFLNQSVSSITIS